MKLECSYKVVEVSNVIIAKYLEDVINREAKIGYTLKHLVPNHESFKSSPHDSEIIKETSMLLVFEHLEELDI